MNKYDNEMVKHITLTNGMMYLQFKELLKYSDKVQHGIFLRHGGVSKGYFESLNVRIPASVMLNYEQKNVENNVKKICKVLEVDINRLYKGRQAHTNSILEVFDDKYSYMNHVDDAYDGYIHTICDTYSMVTTADCVPVILYDKEKNILVNIHSGWKGTLLNIVGKGIETLKIKHGSLGKNILAFLGPSINECCFTTKDESFVMQFLQLGIGNDYFSKIGEEFHVNLQKIITSELIKAGVSKENIYDCNICTKCNQKDFYSYRKNTEEGKVEYGCFATIAGLK